MVGALVAVLVGMEDVVEGTGVGVVVGRWEGLELGIKEAVSVGGNVRDGLAVGGEASCLVQQSSMGPWMESCLVQQS
eukprot:CAMPEP_0118707690 /NCGR_PEP_ID=MMETSP0800-20121206/21368_1 /TAXON_ID=210618 ORGANISM="Striatella unipunctata, Strain CCMP2910" /NCGR_SAMPLE_ID=MMETSP0800 /ASSEMBLY_ACC=CAM_ASM_000638 /LENGTH=76 /DNA_ID=CAMNT_0006610593 /DNA_START=180 /DNA_END=407 /DNA_ORIENTATION=+